MEDEINKIKSNLLEEIKNHTRFKSDSDVIGLAYVPSKTMPNDLKWHESSI